MSLLQVLLAIYFFLAGVAVSQGRLLWLIPLASISCAGLLGCFALLLRPLSASYRRGLAV